MPSVEALAAGGRLGRYEIAGSLGSGAMGEVFRARDPSLAREVALKVLPPELAGEPGRLARFEREARALAALNHPHIVTIYSVEEADGLHFLTMELVRGRTLDEAVPRRGLPLDRFFELAIALASAVAAAHERGVVHRDLKPRNVMVADDGTLKVLDFGLARREEVTETDVGQESTDTLTRSGVVLGTLPYMSPEQLEGQPADARSDIFALGVVLFEMLTGRRPFAGRSSTELLTCILRDEPPPVDEVRPELPHHLGRMVAMCLEKDPAARYQSSRDVANELVHLRRELAIPPGSAAGRSSSRSATLRPRRTWRWWVAGAAVAAAALVAALRFGPPDLPAARSPGRPVLAVVPLTNASGDVANDHLGLGFADSLITRLAGVAAVDVVSRSQTSEALRTGASHQRLARDLGAEYLVDGSIQRSGERLRVSVTLVEAATSVVRRSWEHQGTFAELFDLQTRVAVAVSEELALSLSEEDRRRLEAPLARAVPAYDDYARARLLLQRPDRTDEVDRGIALLEQAIARDPDFTLAHATLGDVYWTRYRTTGDTAWAERALAATREAARLDRDDPEVRIALARVYAGTGRGEEALEELRAVTARRPGSDDAWRVLGQILVEQGRPEEALVALQRAQAVGPGYAPNHEVLGYVYYQMGHFAAAAEAYARAADLQPDNAWLLESLGAARQSAGDVAGAIDAYERAIGVEPQSDVAQSNLGVVHYRSGDFASAAAAFRRAVEIAPHRASYRRNLGDTYERLGRRDDAAAAYHAAVDILGEQLTVTPEDPLALSLRAVCRAKLGERDEALRDAREAAGLAPTNREVRYRSAVVLALVGRQEEALDALAEAFAQGASRRSAREDHDFAVLRELPRFQALLREGDDVRNERR